MILNSKVLNIVGVSIKGIDKKHNQDSYYYRETNKYILIVVSDGLGSAKYSDLGSKLVMISVQKSITQWRTLQKQEINILLKMIHFNWNILVNDLQYEMRDCASTCLFVYVDKETKNTTIAQLGDGLIFLKSSKGLYMSVSNVDFNYTKSLGVSKKAKDWIVKKMDVDLASIKFFIATDGVAEDIVEGKEENFLDYLISSVQEADHRNRHHHMRNILKNWPTKFHSDDKTICISWSKR
jgi:hypothetical protein